MRRIDMMDAAFLYVESRETPMHVGGINLFEFPEGADEQQFMQRLSSAYHSTTELRKPFGDYVSTGKLGRFGPLYWDDDQDLDLDYHVRHSALPQPGRYRELFALTSRLHGTLLDRNRPLWEVHLIEGLQDRQFAVYSKLHHATIDGVAGLRLTEGMCSTNKRTRTDHSPFSQEAFENVLKAKRKGRPKTAIPQERDLRNLANILKEQLGTTAHLLSIVKSYAQTWLGMGTGLTVPFRHVPRTSINSQVSGSRRFVAQSWDFARVQAVSKATGATINDVVLAMCSGALRSYLLAHDEIPEHSLRAMVPVSVRAADDFQSSNAVSFITANLGTKHADPEDRLRTVMESTRAGKEVLSGLTSTEAALYAGLAQMPLFVSNLFGVAELFPAFSTTISNVPGPRKQLYWNGAPLIGMYPASAIFHGFALNITLVSYRGKLDFGIMACRRSMPQVQRLIDYLDEALVELETMSGIA
jgi:diacylglycerol O-acyltransferase